MFYFKGPALSKLHFHYKTHIFTAYISLLSNISNNMTQIFVLIYPNANPISPASVHLNYFYSLHLKHSVKFKPQPIIFAQGQFDHCSH